MLMCCMYCAMTRDVQLGFESALSDRAFLRYNSPRSWRDGGGRHEVVHIHEAPHPTYWRSSRAETKA